MAEPTQPPMLLLKLRTCDDLPDSPLNLAGEAGALPSLFLDVTMGYYPEIAALRIPNVIDFDCYGARRRCVVLSVEPAPEATACGVVLRRICRKQKEQDEHQLVQPPAPPVVSGPSPCSSPGLIKAIELALAIDKITADFRRGSMSFDYGSNQDYQARMRLPGLTAKEIKAFRIEPIPEPELSSLLHNSAEVRTRLYMALGLDISNTLNITDTTSI